MPKEGRRYVRSTRNFEKKICTVIAVVVAVVVVIVVVAVVVRSVAWRSR